MDLCEAWRIARPVEAFVLKPYEVVPSFDSEDQRDALQELKRGGPVDKSLAAWLELRPPSAVAAEMAEAAVFATHHREQAEDDVSERNATKLMVALERQATSSLKHCSTGEILTMIPCYFRVRESGDSDWGPETTVISESRPIDQGMDDVASSPRPRSTQPEPPPWDSPIEERMSRFREWIYHRSSFRLEGRPFREILRHAYLIDEGPAKLEFRAIDTMREAYRLLTEEARTYADLHRLKSYESMEFIVWHSTMGSLGQEFPEDWRREWPELSQIVDRWISRDPYYAVPAGSPSAPAHVPACTMLALLGKLARQSRQGVVLVDETVRGVERFLDAKFRLITILGAIADVRINTGKVTLRQFVDWAAEATTLYHATMLDIALQVAQTPGIGVARYLGESVALRKWKELGQSGWDADRFASEIAKTDGTLTAIESLG